jgi:large subunit ribosomal protein L32
MAVPKRRTSHAKQGMRRSHHHLKPLAIQYCGNCEQPVLPHRVCPNCGHYQGRLVAEEKTKTEK